MKLLKHLVGNKTFHTGSLECRHISVPFDISRTLTAVFLTDLHYSVLEKDPLRLDRGIMCISEELLDEIIDNTRSIQPDLVLFGGDFVNFDGKTIHNLTPFLEKMAHIPGIGCYAVCGNHEFKIYDALDEVIPVLKDVGIKFLWNEHVIVQHHDSSFALCGLADFFTCMVDTRFLGEISEEIPRLVLSHNPDCMHMAKAYRVDLMLSGHTHGGQIKFPIIGSIPPYIYAIYSCFPLSIRRKLPYNGQATAVQHWKWIDGFHVENQETFRALERKSKCKCLEPRYFEFGNGVFFEGPGQKIDYTIEEWTGTRYLYISRGLGTHPPMRLRCRPELTVVHLEPKTSERV